MRSFHPIPGNPWPHDMTITIEDSPEALLELLWVREAWRLAVELDDAPPPLTDTPQFAAGDHDTATWATEWAALWTEALTHAANDVDRTLIQRLQTTPPGSDERREILAQLVGPTWSERFGFETLGDGFHRWNSRHIEGVVAGHRQRAVDRERACLDALVPAWRAGLTRVVVLPCCGTFTRTIGAHALLVTTETRDDGDRYSTALAQFDPAGR